MPIQPAFTTADLAQYPVSIQQSLAALYGPFPEPVGPTPRAPVILKFPDPCADDAHDEGVSPAPVSATRRRAA
jgi:hypothetical protein